MDGQQHQSNSLPPNVEFPGPGVNFTSFRNQEGLPQIRLPRTFILAARGLQVPSG